MENDDESTPQRTSAHWILAGLIALFGLVLFVGVVRQGRADSAVLFVALPVFLAAGLALTPAGRPTARSSRPPR